MSIVLVAASKGKGVGVAASNRLQVVAVAVTSLCRPAASSAVDCHGGKSSCYVFRHHHCSTTLWKEKTTKRCSLSSFPSSSSWPRSNMQQYHAQSTSSSITSDNNNSCRRFSSSGDSSQQQTSVDNNEEDTVRLSKLISHYGQNVSMSRRQAERHVRDGDVTVAGKIVRSPHYLVPWKDKNAVKLGGKHLVVVSDKQNQQQDTGELWLVHKLYGEVVSEKDPLGRPSLMERLIRSNVGRLGKKKQQQLHLKPIGRLDMATEGLLLVTSNGRFARDMELPHNKVHRTYRVRVHGKLTPHKLKAIRSGLSIQNVHYKPMKVELEASKQRHQAHGTNTWLRVTCTEGKNRQVRNVFGHLGLSVTRLIRISYGDYQLQTIPPGMALEVPMKSLSQQRRKGPLFNRRKKKKKVESKEEVLGEPVQWVHHV